MPLRTVRVLTALLLAASFVGAIGAHASAATEPRRILVADYFRGRVVAFDAQSGTQTGELITSFPSGFSQPTYMAIGPDGDLYVDAGNGGTFDRYIYRIDAHTGAVKSRLTTSGIALAPDGFAFGPDGLLYVGTRDGAIHRFDPATNRHIDRFTSVDNPLAMTFGPDGELYVTNAAGRFTGGGVSRVNRLTGEVTRIGFGGDYSNPTGITFGPDGDLYIASQYNGRIFQLDGTTGVYERTLVTLPVNFGSSAGILFGPEGNLYVPDLTSGSAEGVWRFDGRTGQFIDRFITLDGNTGLTGIVFDPPVPIPEPGGLCAAAGAGLLILMKPRRRR